jgi:glycosyltransferase involved in cell wall biosynthesis
MSSLSNYTFLIVTPSYNQGAFIEQTITSVLEQKTQNSPQIEYLVQDGGSNDNTLEILKKYDQDIEWRSEPDEGQTDAINTGIDYFSQQQWDPETTIFAYINSDDYYLPGAFQTVATAFATHPQKDWVVGEYQIEADKHQSFHQVLVRGWKKVLKWLYSPALLLVANPIAQPATFIRWRALQQVGQFNQRLDYVMDYEYWLRLQAAVGNPVFVSQILASFRIHDVSKGGADFEKQFAEQLSVARQHTSNPLLLGLHQLHNKLTLLGYHQTK